jgi:hypothetical protein
MHATLPRGHNYKELAIIETDAIEVLQRIKISRLKRNVYVSSAW